MKNSFKIKASIFLISSIISLGLLEVGLRVAGRIVLDRTQKEYIPPFDEGNSEDHDHTYEVYSKKKEPSLALCVGDSFTNGGNVQSYDTYPYHLFSNFHKTKNKVSVLNFGKCESSTFDSYERIKTFIEERKLKKEKVPNKVIILTGSADLFGINFGIVNDQKLIPYEVPTLNGIKSFRIYKVYRFFKYEIFKKFSLNESLRLSYEPISKLETEYAKIIQKNAVAIFKNSSVSYNSSKSQIEKLSKGINSKLSEVFKKEVFPNEEIRSDLYIERILIYNLGIFSRKNKHKQAIEHTLEFIKNNKTFFWKDNSLKAVKYYFTQALILQSKYTPIQIAQKLEKDFHGQKTNDYKKMLSMLNGWDEQFKSLNLERMKTWDKIYNLAKKNNIKLILQNYPSEYHSANDMIKKVSIKYDLALVDNYNIFKALIKRDGRERYLFDDDHCTPEGYELMAKNVYNTIMSGDK